MKVILLYLLIMNAAGVASMLVDKHKAKKKLWRIPEATLFAIALLGGSIGSLVGMYLFRHKTKHLSFTLGIPAIIAVQLLLVWLLIR